MPPSFTAEDLGLGTDLLDQLTAACANNAVPLPIDAAINLAVGKVDLYTAGYALTDDHYKRLVRALAVYELYEKAGGGIPTAQEKNNTDALQELHDIRDGKFPALAKLGQTAGSVSGTGAKWGSDERIGIRS